MRGCDICDIGVVRRLPRQQAYTRWTANCDRAKVFAIVCSLLNKMLLNIRHVVKGTESLVLVISQDEDDVRLPLLHVLGDDSAGTNGQCRQRRQAKNWQHGES